MSSSLLYIVYPPATPLGIIDTSFTFDCVGKYLPTTACPASWYAVNFLSLSDITLSFFSSPTVTFLTASSISSFSISSCLFIVAIIAASFKILASSAPVNPAVSSAMLSKLTLSEIFLSFACIFRISNLPLMSGDGIVICLSNLPGLNKALSNISGLFVAANTIIVSSELNPSISTKSWFSVWLFSDSPPLFPVLLAPIASISSINTIHGANFLAFSNSFLTLEAPKPTNISTNSDPLIDINGTFASPAIAFAISVFPVPGFPYSNTPFGIFAPIFVNFSGVFKKSTISINSSFSSSSPATSLNLIFVFLSVSSYTFPFSPPNPCILYIIINSAIIISVGKKLINTVKICVNVFFGFCISSISFPSATFCCTNVINASVFGTTEFFSFSSSFTFTFIDVLPTVISTFSILPSLICFIKSVYANSVSSLSLLFFRINVVAIIAITSITNKDVNPISIFLSLLFLSSSLLFFIFIILSLVEK